MKILDGHRASKGRLQEQKSKLIAEELHKKFLEEQKKEQDSVKHTLDFHGRVMEAKKKGVEHNMESQKKEKKETEAKRTEKYKQAEKDQKAEEAKDHSTEENTDKDLDGMTHEELMKFLDETEGDME